MSKIQHRRGTTTEWTTVNPVLVEGEIGVDLTTGNIKVGNGVSAWNALDYITGEGGGSGGTVELRAQTVDGDDDFRIILFSNGNVRAIPYATPAPIAPTGLTVTARLSSVGVSWTASSTPSASYAVIRDGIEIAVTSSLRYRDLAITVGNTYSYRVQTVDPYGQRSALTSAVTGFVNPATNSAPTVAVRAWPTVAPTNGRSILRVNASDVDAQVLALTLSVDSGAISATDDPSVWYYTPGA